MQIEDIKIAMLRLQAKYVQHGPYTSKYYKSNYDN